MESVKFTINRVFVRIGSLAVGVFLAAFPIAALAETMGSDDPVGKPFPLWVFLVPVAGLIALAGAYAAKSAIEKPGRR